MIPWERFADYRRLLQPQEECVDLTQHSVSLGKDENDALLNSNVILECCRLSGSSKVVRVSYIFKHED